jgi:hypothetical protein
MIRRCKRHRVEVSLVHISSCAYIIRESVNECATGSRKAKGLLVQRDVLHCKLIAFLSLTSTLLSKVMANTVIS